MHESGTCYSSDDSWNKLEEALRHKFLPALTGRQAFNDLERELLSLPAKLGKIGVTVPSLVSTSQHDASRMVSTQLISNIQKPACADAEQVHRAQKELRAEVHHSNQQKISSCVNEVRSSLPQNLQRANEQSCESGA